ncbi:PAAR-like domain-containing protein [Chondromyces crocatus]|uniref:Uncharacterized protein n=1 Tax=Chondromyces crocatus TaxID=52 RepID=A0A0K1E8K9_CHOCO|nr:PAAR-like domain-containing protein [Chondromyces crocatus]AKT37022.1 uncharacterized protein CMC5_011480 [Chondromyces crocatus]
MGKVTAYYLDTITDRSGHTMAGFAVSVCLTPAAPAPLPIPYPTFGNTAEGITDPCMRTKIEGAPILTVGGCMKTCHGNEPGTLREVVSLNITGPCFPWLGAPLILIELGMAGITGSLGQMNKGLTFGLGAKASGASGAGGAGGGPSGPGAGGPGAGGPNGPGNGGGGGGGSNDGAAPPSPPAPPGAEGQASAGHPVDVITGTLFTPPCVDFTLPGFLWVRWIRSYRTSAVRQRCGLGWGWSHNLAWRGERHGETFTLIDDRGSETTLVLPTGDETLLLPHGRKLHAEGDAIVVDLDDGLLRVLRPSPGGTNYALVALRDAHGNHAALRWENEEIVEIVDSVGRRATLTRDGALRTWELHLLDDEGEPQQKLLVAYELDERGDLVQVIDAGGVSTRYEYDEDHYLLAEHRPDGIVFRFVHAEFHGEKRCVETWGERPGGDLLAELGAVTEDAKAKPRGIFHTRLTYGPGRREATVTDGAGSVHRYAGNDLGLVERYIDPRGNATLFRYDALGRVVSMSDGSLGATRRQVDASGRIASITLADGATLRFQHDDETGLRTLIRPDGTRASVRLVRGKVVERLDEQGRKTLATYDARGKNTAITWPDGGQDLLEYDTHGNLAKYTTARGAVYRYAFDFLGQPISLETPTGATYHLDYDSRGDLVALTGPGGQRSAFLPDRMRRTELQQHTGGGEQRNRWVADALVEQTKADGSRYRMGYDALLRLQWIENPAGERFTVRHDGAGNPIRQQTFAGLTYGFEYDGADRLALVLNPEEKRLVERRDAQGRILTREHSGRTSARFAYDEAGRMLSAEAGIARVEYGYDESGRLVREQQAAGGFRFEVRYQYGPDGRIAERSYSSGWHVRYGAEKDGESIAITSSLGNETLHIERDLEGRELLRRRETDGLALRTQRNVLGFPEHVVVEDADGASLRVRSFRWDARGPVAAVTDTAAGMRSYELDVFGRPVSAQGLGTNERFRYSPHGTALPEGATWSLGAGGRPTHVGEVLLRWDRCGRLVERRAPDPQHSWRYGYDDDDRLVEAVRGDGVRVQYLYDAFGRRLAETVGGATTWFGWDGNAPVEEQTSTGGKVLRVFHDDGHTPLVEGSEGQGLRLVAADAAGTPYLYLGNEGETAELDLSTWGEVARTQGDVGALRFAGQRADATTGLHYNRNRYYAPDLHVFLTPDPLGMLGSVQDVGFVPNPTLYIDPLGLLTIITASNDPALINAYYGNYASQYPGATILTPSQVTPGSLAGETEVMIDTHGVPGQIEWAGQDISGTELGDRLNAAGFNGSAPGARVDVIACNSATKPRGGQSVSQAVANRTGATTSGGRALFNSSFLGNQGWSGLVSGMPSGTPPSGLRVNGFGSWVNGIQPQPGTP